MDKYEIMLKQRYDAVEKYKRFSLEDLIRFVFIECKYDMSRIDNVYINERVNFPNVWGCFKEGNNYITYYTDSMGVIEYKVYDDPHKFMDVFITNSVTNKKYEKHSKTL